MTAPRPLLQIPAHFPLLAVSALLGFAGALTACGDEGKTDDSADQLVATSEPPPASSSGPQAVGGLGGGPGPSGGATGPSGTSTTTAPPPSTGGPSGSGGAPPQAVPNGGTGANPLPPTAGPGTAQGGPANGGTGALGAGGSGGDGSAGDGGAAGSSSAGTGPGGAVPSAGAGGQGGGGAPSGENVFHIFMLMGQSNMAGVADKQASDDNTDERLLVLGGCNQPAGQWNVAKPPLSDCPGEKGWNLSTSVDPGIWFGKTLLEKLPEGHTIGLVGTAESGESINTFVSGGSHHQMILRKIEEAKMAENAHFSGIIFHQGESDNEQGTWPDKVVQLYEEVKAAFGVDYDVPFILGELPQGGCCAGHNTRVHEAAEKLPMGYWVSQEGTNVMDQYHFDHDSVVLMGKRYGETMIEALGW